MFLATRTDNRDIVYGEKSAEFVLNEMYIPPDTKIATDDGSVGFCGNVCELLTELEPAPIFACGPTPMLKKLTEISRQWNVQAFFSMESRMACGFGACNGCVIHTIDGYKKVCSDGPIFPAQMLKEF
ncbi:hypothetical protein DRQ33_07945 [bacterium]|nr:MAG: hypothetical protein DRQ33_07945 [bacterium]